MIAERGKPGGDVKVVGGDANNGGTGGESPDGGALIWLRGEC